MTQKFLERMASLYGAPAKTDDLPGFLAEYREGLRGYSERVLDRAADHIRDNRKYRSWPTVAECREAASAAQAWEVDRSQPMPAKTPMFILDRDVDCLQWPTWMDALDRGDRECAETTGVIVTTARWPDRGRLLFVGHAGTHMDFVHQEAGKK